MPTYESDITIPPHPGIQKTGPGRYAFPKTAADMLQERLPEEDAVKVQWTDGNKLAVMLENERPIDAQDLAHAKDAVQDVLGIDAQVSDFAPVAEAAQD